MISKSPIGQLDLLDWLEKVLPSSLVVGQYTSHWCDMGISISKQILYGLYRQNHVQLNIDLLYDTQQCILYLIPHARSNKRMPFVTTANILGIALVKG